MPFHIYGLIRWQKPMHALYFRALVAVGLSRYYRIYFASPVTWGALNWSPHQHASVAPIESHARHSHGAPLPLLWLRHDKEGERISTN
jgi:hypothetical protein